MSYYLMAFSEKMAPKSENEFMKWYESQTDWKDDYDYNNPDNASGKLKEWFDEFIKTFPPMNGPLASDDVDNPHVTDYSVASDFVYGAFAWSVADEAITTAFNLGKEYDVGIFDPNGKDKDLHIYLSDGHDLYHPEQHISKEPPINRLIHRLRRKK